MIGSLLLTPLPLSAVGTVSRGWDACSASSKEFAEILSHSCEMSESRPH